MTWCERAFIDLLIDPVTDVISFHSVPIPSTDLLTDPVTDLISL